MSTMKHLRTAVSIFAISLVAVSPALAQGKGKAKEKGRRAENTQVERTQRERPTLQRRSDGSTARTDRATAAERRRAENRGVYDRRDDRRDDDRREDVLYGGDRDGRRRGVPPGWCQGRGNPHNTPENCGYRSSRRDDYYRSDDRYGGYNSYSEAHAAFHRALDREYADRAARRRNDPVYQIRLRAEKAADHDRWHERTGTRH